jgi:hypothetical protein
VATSDHDGGGGPGERALRYLTSRKHLAGTAGGLVGVGLALAGMGGPLWPLVVGGLYAAGALAAPTDPPPLDAARQLLAHAAEEAARLQGDLAGIAGRVHAAAGQLPPGTGESFGRVESKLADMLGHPNALADPEVLHVLSTTVRKDLDQIVGTYLALPTHLRDRALPARDRTAGEELLHQLGLLDGYLTETSGHLFRSHTQDIVNLSTYLESRGPSPRDAPG